MNCSSPKIVEINEVDYVVPCGICLACLVNKREDWSFRLMQEYKRSRSAAFVTLTYDAKYVPDTGVCKTHVQKFMKRLRKVAGDKLRYYAVGEYGTRTGRPHYHLIIFNYDIAEKVLRKVWPFGLTHVGKVTEASIKYTTKYCIQRNTFPSGLSKPFALMSRGYGLGGHYLTDDMIAWHRNKNGEPRAYSFIHGIKGRLPRYYKDKIWPLVPGTYWQYIRESLSKKLSEEALKAQLENVRIIREAGYENPDAIISEMRNAVLSRVKEKVAYTQTI